MGGFVPDTSVSSSVCLSFLKRLRPAMFTSTASSSSSSHTARCCAAGSPCSVTQCYKSAPTKPHTGQHIGSMPIGYQECVCAEFCTSLAKEPLWRSSQSSTLRPGGCCSGAVVPGCGASFAVAPWSSSSPSSSDVPLSSSLLLPLATSEDVPASSVCLSLSSTSAGPGSSFSDSSAKFSTGPAPLSSQIRNSWPSSVAPSACSCCFA